MPRFGEFTKKKHAGLTEQADLHTPKSHNHPASEITSEQLAWARMPDLACRIKVGTYTGDGSTGQAITGIGFTPKYVRIWKYVEVETNSVPPMERMSGMYGDLCMQNYDTCDILSDRIISLDSDGFTVDDRGANQDPNALNIVYNYMALG